jgi:ADP-Ribosyltransferase in polyvalent proteins
MKGDFHGDRENPTLMQSFDRCNSLYEITTLRNEKSLMNYLNVNPIERDNVATNNFWNWFKDSKAVDQCGRPIAVYHGSNAKFQEFDMAKAVDGAHWFTPLKMHAESFGNYVIQANLSLQNPLEIQNSHLEKEWDNAHPSGEHDSRSLIFRDFVRVFVERAKALGCDGLIVRKMGDRDVVTDLFLAFDPCQIKASDNTGRFDPENPCIFE